MERSIPLNLLSKDLYITDPAKYAYNNYLSTTSNAEASAGMFLWYGAMLFNSERSSYQLAAGSCTVEAALHPAAAYGLEERVQLIDEATLNWDWAFDQERAARNDIAERAKWALSQVPTYKAIASFMVKSEVQDIQREQEGLFKDYFDHVLNRWDHEDLDGHVLESLTSYFLHRSNQVLDHEQPIYSVQSCIRDDYHAAPERRVDVDIYHLQQGLKYGIQVKGGRISDPHRNNAEHHRIFFNNARKLLCLPYTERAVERTLKAIVSDNPTYKDDLDTIAADHRARMKGYCMLPEYIGTSFMAAEAA